MTIVLASPPSRSANNPSRMSSTATAWSGVSALNGDSLNRSLFSISGIVRVKTLALEAVEDVVEVSR